MKYTNFRAGSENIIRSVRSAVTGSEAARLFFAFACTFAVSIGASTTLLDTVIGRDHLVIVNYNASPIEWLSLVLVMYAVLSHGRVRTISKEPASQLWLQNIAGAVFLITGGFAIFFTHPDDASYQMLQQFLSSFPVTGGPTFAAVVAIILIIPFFPAYAFIDPRNARTRWGELLIVFFALVGAFFSSVLEALYYEIVLPVVIDALAHILLLFSWNVYANALRGVISIDGFRVSIGPACAGFSYIFLFLIFFGYVLYELSKKQRMSLLRSIIAGIAGLLLVFFLNIIRIASLMLVGRISPNLAITLFHSVVGSVYFFLFFIIFFPLMRLWMQRRR